MKSRIVKTFIVGSRYFFNDVDTDRDIDIIVILSKDTSSSSMLDVKNEVYTKFQSYKKIDILYVSEKISLDDLLKIAESRNICILRICTCLVPEIAEYLNLKISDLPKIKNYVYKLKEINKKWKYYELIYESYIENNSFTLTEEQRQKAKEIYLEGKINKSK